MKLFQPILVALAVSSAALLHAQTPQIVSAAKVGTADKVRVMFNMPVTPAGTTTLLADDFSGTSVDPAKWTINNAGFESGSTTAESSVEQANGELTIDVETAAPGWGGKSLRTANPYSLPTTTSKVSGWRIFGKSIGTKVGSRPPYVRAGEGLTLTLHRMLVNFSTFSAPNLNRNLRLGVRLRLRLRLRLRGRKSH